MTKNHLPTLASPKSWKVERKKHKWIAKPMPGPHKKDKSITLNLLLKEILGYAKTTKEIKKILNDSLLLVDGKSRKEHKFPIGLMDIIELPKLKEVYRVGFDNKGKIIIEKINENEKAHKVCKIINKTAIKNKKIQVNLHDGKNIIVDKCQERVGDSVIIDLKNNKITKGLPLQKNANILLIGGKNIGRKGKLVEIVSGKGIQKTKVIYESEGTKHETLKDYVFVLEGKN